MSTNTVVILEEHFTSNNLFVSTLVFEPSDKYWVNPYYFLLSFLPKGVVEKRVQGKLVKQNTYITERRITFKRSVHDVQAMAIAINEYARGKGKSVAEGLTYFSDPNKSAHATSPEKLKTLMVTSAVNAKNNKEIVVNLSVSQASMKAGEKANSFVVTFAPWDALALVNSLSYMIRLTRDGRLRAGPRPFAQADDPTGTEG